MAYKKVTAQKAKRLTARQAFNFARWRSYVLGDNSLEKDLWVQVFTEGTRALKKIASNEIAKAVALENQSNISNADFENISKEFLNPENAINKIIAYNESEYLDRKIGQQKYWELTDTQRMAKKSGELSSGEKTEIGDSLSNISELLHSCYGKESVNLVDLNNFNQRIEELKSLVGEKNFKSKGAVFTAYQALLGKAFEGAVASVLMRFNDETIGKAIRTAGSNTEKPDIFIKEVGINIKLADMGSRFSMGDSINFHSGKIFFSDIFNLLTQSAASSQDEEAIYAVKRMLVGHWFHRSPKSGGWMKDASVQEFMRILKIVLASAIIGSSKTGIIAPRMAASNNEAAYILAGTTFVRKSSILKGLSEGTNIINAEYNQTGTAGVVVNDQKQKYHLYRGKSDKGEEQLEGTLNSFLSQALLRSFRITKL